MAAAAKNSSKLPVAPSRTGRVRSWAMARAAEPSPRASPRPAREAATDSGSRATAGFTSIQPAGCDCGATAKAAWGVRASTASAPPQSKAPAGPEAVSSPA